MHGTRLAEEAAAELLENALGLDEDLPARLNRRGLIRAMSGVCLEPNRIRDLSWQPPVRGWDIWPCQRARPEPIELGHRPRLERYGGPFPVRALEHELMGDKIERDRDAAMIGGQRQ